MNTLELNAALFSAEAVAHMRGYEREILPLADLARGMAAHIEELRAALAEVCGALEESDSGAYQTLADARAVLAQTPAPLAPEMIRA